MRSGVGERWLRRLVLFGLVGSAALWLCALSNVLITPHERYRVSLFDGCLHLHWIRSDIPNQLPQTVTPGEQLDWARPLSPAGYRVHTINGKLTVAKFGKGFFIKGFGLPPLSTRAWIPSFKPSDTIPKISLPLWIPTLGFAIIYGCQRWTTRRRAMRGHCLRCGYDLTGNVSGRCPECGTECPRVAAAVSTVSNSDDPPT